MEKEELVGHFEAAFADGPWLLSELQSLFLASVSVPSEERRVFYYFRSIFRYMKVHVFVSQCSDHLLEAAVSTCRTPESLESVPRPVTPRLTLDKARSRQNQSTS